MLKANSKKVLDIIATQTKRNATQAYKEVHPEASNTTATVNAYQLMKKPEAQIYLQEHVNKAQQTIVSLMDSDKEEMQYKASVEVLDRNTGKSIQRTENVTTGVTLHIDLASALSPEAEA